VIERTAIARFVDSEILFEEAVVRAVGDQLDRLVAEEGHARFLLNFSGVRHLSGAVLGRLARLWRRVEPARGRVQLCGLDPLLRDMVRISHLDQVFEVFADEAEALGIAAASEPSRPE
jgi:anti-anti-sigma factor